MPETARAIGDGGEQIDWQEVGSSQGIGLRPDPSSPRLPTIDPMDRLAAELKTFINVDCGTLEQTGYLTVEELVEDMEKHPLPGQILEGGHHSSVHRFTPVLWSPDQGKKTVILVDGNAEKNDALRSASAISLPLMDIIGDFLRTHELERDALSVAVVGKDTYRDVAKLVTDSPGRQRFLNQIDKGATANQAFYAALRTLINKHGSDMHIEPMSDGTARIRYRVLGVLEESPFRISSAIVGEFLTAIKVKAKMDISEHRRPQDGRIGFGPEERAEHRIPNGYSLRLSTIPTNYERREKIVIRLLKAAEETQFKLDRIGLQDDIVKEFRRMFNSPNGLILVSGPTGSGKTTTLYAALNELNTIDRNVTTIEDPIEYDFDGINQIPVDERIDNTFAKLLRSVMRQDPDVIMVGEIRDKETADAAIDAGLTGHVVLSTIHTNSAVHTVTRLLKLGINPDHIQGCLLAVMAQRLVRIVDPLFAPTYDAREELNNELYLSGEDRINYPVYIRRPMQVPTNDGKNMRDHERAYTARTILPEFWILGREERALINKGVTDSAQYLNIAMKRGLRPLWYQAMRMLLDGKTTIDELRGAIRPEELTENAKWIKANIIDKHAKREAY